MAILLHEPAWRRLADGIEAVAEPDIGDKHWQMRVNKWILTVPWQGGPEDLGSESRRPLLQARLEM
jgi:hypothetical protein